MAFIFLLSLVNFLYRIIMLASSRWRKMKLKWDCLERNKWKKYDFILDFICEQHCDEGSINFINLGRNICDWCSRPWLPLRMMFPRQSLCSMKYHGSGGGTNTLHASCLLTLNIIHDKVKKNWILQT